MKKRIPVISWLFVFLWMALIFYLSHQPGTESSNLSGGLLNFFNTLVPFDIEEINGLHTLLRKGAHLSAYFMLAILLMIAFGQSNIFGKRRILFTFISCLVYAISDEVHQLFISGRSGQITDVLIDCLGGALGIGFYSLLLRFKKPFFH